jgi:predicted ribosome quality control (RQC) complex YloA/Tae2 family protein
MKTQISGFDVRRLVKDLQKLAGAYLDKAYQLSGNELVFRFNIKGEGKAELYVNFKGHLYLSTESKPKPEQPSTFAMVLRKHLSNAKVIAISQYEFDRIIVLDLYKNNPFRLILELFGEGNAIIIRDDETGSKIINTLFQRSWSSRTLRPGHPYEFPPAMKNPDTASVDDISNSIKNSKKDLVRTLATDINLGGLYAEEVCFRTAIDKKTKAAELDDEQIRSVSDTIKRIFEEVESETGAHIIYSDDEPVDVIPFMLKLFDTNKTVPVPDLSAGLESYFSMAGIVDEKTRKDASSALTGEKARLLRQLEQQKEAMEKFKKTRAEKKMMADLIYQHYQLIESVLNRVSELRKNYEWDEILDDEMVEFDELEELNPHDGSIKLKLTGPAEGTADVIIKLDFRLDVNRNAEIYYEAAKSAREKLEGASSALLVTEKSLNNIEDSIKRSVADAEAAASSTFQTPKRRKIFWFEKHKWFLSSDGFLVVAGSDASSNEKVVKKYLKQGDRYVHADLHGAPSAVVRKREGDVEQFPERTLVEACNFAVVHSKAWSSGVGAASAYWVNADQVSKTPQTGEFVPKGAFIIRGKRNYVKDVELKVAIGMIEYEGVELLMCGPRTAVSQRTEKYLILSPGKTKKTNIAKKLSSLFKISLDEIMKLLPPGDADIAESVSINIDEF